MGKKKVSVMSIVFFVLAGLLAVYTIWALMNSIEVVKGEQIAFKGNEYVIINYYMTSALSNGLTALILFGIGWVIQLLAPNAEPVVFAGIPTEAPFETMTVDTDADSEEAYVLDETAEGADETAEGADETEENQ